MKITKKDIMLHDLGVTIRHKSPFHNLPILSNQEALTEDFFAKWVKPFYMTNLGIDEDDFLRALIPIYDELNIHIVKKLLGEFNWRHRIVGSYFTAIQLYYEVEDNIGNLFLRSDVCLAGKGYCLALAFYNNEKSITYLRKYLNYYLNNPDLPFDQPSAMAALAYLDKMNHTQHLPEFIPQWNEFVQNRPHWDLNSWVESFEKEMQSIQMIRDKLNS